jgi:hypothetical protein
MKMFVRHAVTLLAITVACQAGLALAEDYYPVGGSDQSTPANAEKATTLGQSACSSCCPTECGCDQCDGCCCRLGCDDNCDNIGIVGWVGLDAFNGISDATGPSNFGEVQGINIGAPLFGLRDYGLGWQCGISYGIYDFDGRATLDDIPGQSAAQTQQQTFVTTGFFRKAHGDQRLSFGLVYDWMYNTQWGVFGVDPTLGQWRGQVEYSLSGCNSLGIWVARKTATRGRSSIAW